MNAPEIVVVGAGHNGLVAAVYLARAGRRVLVLERRAQPGGQLVGPSLYPAARLRPDIVRELDLVRHGLDAPDPGGSAPSEPRCHALRPDGGLLSLGSGADAATLDAIRRLSARDAARWPEFVAYLDTAARFVEAAYRTAMPRLERGTVAAHAMPLGRLLWSLRRLGRRDAFRVIRSLPMTALEFADEWFESEPLRATLGALAVHGVTLGPMSAGTGYTLIHNWLNRGGLAHRSGDGDPQRIVDALVAALRAAGGELRCDAEVAQVLVDRQQVTGVRLASGESIDARTVYSALDPRRTLLGLVGAPELPPEFAWQVRSIKLRGSVAKLFLETDGRHGLPDGTTVVAPSLEGLERAYDAAKYGQLSVRPYLEVATLGSTLAVHFQYAPYSLRGSDWETERASLAQRALETLGAHFPALGGSVRSVQTYAPPDLEREYGLTEGDLNHGQLLLDQALFMRPLPGWSDHRTPVDGLYLCGSGVHGGGGISGASGRNAARLELG